LIAPKKKKKREQKIKTDKFKLCISKTEILILLKVDHTGNSEFASLITPTHKIPTIYQQESEIKAQKKKINESVEDWHTVEASDSAA
jgi:ABC-type enterochelin transport system substrate-binding protein